MSDQERYLFPLILKNERLSPFRISSTIEIRRLSKKEKADFFGIKTIDFTFRSTDYGNIRISRIQGFGEKKKGRCPYDQLIGWGIQDGSTDILASNYVVIIDSSLHPDPRIPSLNLTFKLHELTSSSIYIGFSKNKDSFYRDFDTPIHGPFDYSILKKKDYEKFKNLFFLVEKNIADKKFKLISGLYLRALEGGRLTLDLRFLLLVIALEAFYLPEEKDELTFKLSVRASKILSKYGKLGKTEDLFESIKKIYGIRSDLVHKGKSNKLDGSVLHCLANYVRISLNLYLENKGLFEEEFLRYVIFE